MKNVLAILLVLVLGACSHAANPVSPSSAATPDAPAVVPTATLTVHVTHEAMVVVYSSIGNLGSLTSSTAVFKNLPIGETVQITATNNAQTIQQFETIERDTEVTLTIAPPH